MRGSQCSRSDACEHLHGIQLSLPNLRPHASCSLPPTPLRSEANGLCPVTSGEQTIERLDLNQLSIAANAGILVAYVFVCRLIAFLGIRFLKH